MGATKGVIKVKAKTAQRNVIPYPLWQLGEPKRPARKLLMGPDASIILGVTLVP